mmetsp:Transcript_61/g.136  ORF Transcript_61/g.136 Transcript_61/m.136 type:complete len:230 (-) Transcript_61:71-760(-)
MISCKRRRCLRGWCGRQGKGVCREREGISKGTEALLLHLRGKHPHLLVRAGAQTAVLHRLQLPERVSGAWHVTQLCHRPLVVHQLMHDGDGLQPPPWRTILLPEGTHQKPHCLRCLARLFCDPLTDVGDHREVDIAARGQRIEELFAHRCIRCHPTCGCRAIARRKWLVEIEKPTHLAWWSSLRIGRCKHCGLCLLLFLLQEATQGIRHGVSPGLTQARAGCFRRGCGS